MLHNSNRTLSFELFCRWSQGALLVCGLWCLGITSASAKAATSQPTANATSKPATTRQAPSPKPLDAGAQLRRRVKEIKLANGMTFLLVKRSGAPTFSGIIRVRAGGVDEINGYTGLAHIFEHMAFKGTRVVGSRDWGKEQKRLKELVRVGETLSDAMVRSKGKTTPTIALLKKKLKQLQTAHQALVKGNEFTKLYSANGGVGLNASTGKDLTSYYISLPVNRLALWAHQEASRLAAPVMREFYKERSVVMEERRMAMSRGGSRLYEAMMATAFIAHPYRLPTVGWMSDISTIPLSAARQFYKKYYAPGNMVGAIVGDIDIKATTKLLKRTFGLIPKGPAAPPVRTVEPKQRGERRVVVRFSSSPQLMIGFHKPTAPHFHDDVFDVIRELLFSGRSSRLYKALVKTKMAQSDLDASNLPGSRYANLFTIFAKPIAPHTTQALEAVIYKELERLKTEPVPAKELQKVRNNISMSFLRGLRSNMGLAQQLSYFHAVLGDWRYATEHMKRMAKVTPKSIMEVAKTYFKKSNRTVGTLVKESKGTSANPLAGRRMAKPKKLTTDQKRLLLRKQIQAVIKRIRALRKQKPTPALRKQYAAMVRQVRKMIGALRALGPGKPPARRKPTKMSPAQKAKRRALEAHVKAMLTNTQTPSVIIGSLPKGLQKHPATLPTRKLTFKPPTPTIVTLKNGLTLYLLEDRELPLIDIFVLTKTGRLYDPKDKIGLGEITGKVMRSGGFGKLTGDELDEVLAFRAAQLSNRIDAENGLARLAIHRKDLSWGLQMLSGMLRSPRFPKTQITSEKVRMMERHRRYNDQPFRVAIHHFRKLIYGATHRRAMKPTPRSIIAIKRKDLLTFHKTYFHPNNMRMAIVGDFSTPQMLKQIKAVFGAKAWQAKATQYPKIADVSPTAKATVAVVPKDVPQSIIIVGHLGPKRHDPMLLAGKVMNNILGGGGFSSRLMNEIRTKRGLAYFAGSQLMEGTDFGLFAAYTGTRPHKTGQSLKVLVRELTKMATQGKVTKEELTLARKTFLNRFVFRFQSPAQIVFRRAYYDYFGFPKDYLKTYRPRLLALTPKEIKAAAMTYIRPSQFVILVVGQEKKFDIPLSRFTKGKVLRIKLQ